MPRQNQGPYLSDQPNSHGLYEIRWTEAGTGRSKRRSTGESDPRRAQKVLARFVLACEEDLAAPRQTAVTIAEVIDAYLADKTDVVFPSAQRACFGQMRAFFGDTVVAAVDQDQVDAYVAARGRGAITYIDADGVVRGGRKASPASVCQGLLMLRAAIRWCIKNRRLKDAAGASRLTEADIPIFKTPPGSLPRTRWLTREEATAFLAACQPADAPKLTRVYRYAIVMLHTGARRETVHALTWDRIHLDRGLINFAAPGRKVTKKRRGWVPISDELQPILERAYQERTNDWFLGSNVAPVHHFNAAAVAAGLVDEEGKPNVSAHTLRHTFATWAAQDGVPLHDIAGVLHDSILTVERHYAHHCPNHLRSAVNRSFSGALRPSGAQKPADNGLLQPT